MPLDGRSVDDPPVRAGIRVLLEGGPWPGIQPGDEGATGVEFRLAG